MNGRDLVGLHVKITNPTFGDTWHGKAVAYADQPMLLIEQADGSRLMLPAAWASAASTNLDTGDPRE